MYQPQQIKQLQQRTQQLLQQPHSSDNAAVLEDLKAVLRFHEYRYYIMNDPLISDFEYDQLFTWLKKIEAHFPDKITADSPTARVAKGLTKEFPTVQHLVPMLSLDNSYNETDLRDWDKRARELTGLDTLEYCIEPKFDGASISLIYENDLLNRGATRGDGMAGDDITPNIQLIRSVPLSANFSALGIHQIEIRGEVLINKTNFKKYNNALAEQNLPPLANPRNAAAGSLRIKDQNEVSRRNLEAFLYHVSYYTLEDGKPLPPQLQTHSATLDMLWELGFRSPKQEKKLVQGIEAVIERCREYEAIRDDLPYEIDGMVIKVNDYALQDKMGMTTHHPRWAIAFKFKARQATSKLRAVEFQVGRTGSVTPVAKLEPVAIGGVTVSSVSLFNEEVIQEKDLMIGDTVLVERAGDVIPYIVKSLPELRNGDEQPIQFPKQCPVCNSELHKPEGEAVWRCINPNCAAQVAERMIHFVSKDAMDIRSFGEANVRRFVELGLLHDIPGIYSLDFEKIAAMEGFGKKSVDNLKAAIEQSKQQPLHRLIFALGIRYVGETTAKTLAQAVGNLMELKDYSTEQLLQLEDVGPKVAGSIYEYFHTPAILEMLQALEQTGVQFKNEKKETHTGGNLDGQTFLFTGTLPTLKRSEAEALAERSGGKLLGGVSSKLNYLVVGEDAGSKLEKAKKITSIKIISEEEFLKLVQQ
jgi:DNA ligase (NAD+)